MGLYKEFESACQESERCINIQNDVARKNCIKECVAPTCFKILYENNPVSNFFRHFSSYCIIKNYFPSTKLEKLMCEKIPSKVVLYNEVA